MKLIPQRGTISTNPGAPARSPLLSTRAAGQSRIVVAHAMPSAPPPSGVPGPRPLHRQTGSFRGRPIHLTGTANISPNASGSPNNQALHSPILAPIEIHDIKFAFNILVPGVPGGILYLAADGGSIAAQLSLNDDPITNGYVPIWGFDESTNIVNEQTNGDANADETYVYGEFIWHLPRPLYLRPADQINVSFQNQGQQAISAVCRVSMSGCVLENTTDPTSRILPYVATYVSKVFQQQVAGDADQSNELQLANITDDVIHLQKLTGRIDNNVTMGPNMGQHFDDPNTYLGTANLDLGTYLTLQAYTGRGTQLVPYDVNFRDLFGPTRSVPLGGILEPGDYVIAALEKESAIGVYGQASITMIAWREVSL